MRCVDQVGNQARIYESSRVQNWEVQNKKVNLVVTFLSLRLRGIVCDRL